MEDNKICVDGNIIELDIVSGSETSFRVIMGGDMIINSKAVYVKAGDDKFNMHNLYDSVHLTEDGYVVGQTVFKLDDNQQLHFMCMYLPDGTLVRNKKLMEETTVSKTNWR